MPFFGKKSETKKSEGVSYPRQNSNPQECYHQQHHQQQLYYQNSAPNTSVVHVITRTETPSFIDRLFDGPDYHNTVRDPSIPPAPGNYIVVRQSHLGHPAMQPSFMRPPTAPPANQSFSQQGPSSSSTSSSLPPPPSYEEVLAQETKKEL